MELSSESGPDSDPESGTDSSPDSSPDFGHIAIGYYQNKSKFDYDGFDTLVLKLLLDPVVFFIVVGIVFFILTIPLDATGTSRKYTRTDMAVQTQTWI